MNKCYKNNNDSGARDLVFFLQFLFITATTLSCIWLKEIFLVFIKNEELAASYPLGIIIVMAYNYRPIYYGVINKLIYLEKTKILWRITFIAGISNVLFNLVFIPIYGYKIAAVTTFVSLMIMGYVGYAFKSFKENNTAKFYPVAWLLLTIALTVVSMFIVDQFYVYKIIISLVLAAFGAVAFKKLKTNTQSPVPATV